MYKKWYSISLLTVLLVPVQAESLLAEAHALLSHHYPSNRIVHAEAEALKTLFAEVDPHALNHIPPLKIPPNLAQPRLSLTLSNGMMYVSTSMGAPAVQLEMVSFQTITSHLWHTHQFFDALYFNPTGALPWVARTEEGFTEHEMVRAPREPPLWSPYMHIEGSFYYVRIPVLTPEAINTFRSLVSSWSNQHIEGLILDLRNSSGEQEQTALEVASLFCPPDNRKPVFWAENHQKQHVQPLPWTNMESPLVSVPTMLLVDQKTRGSAEVVAALCERLGRKVMLIGEDTSGDFLLRKPYTLSNQMTVQLCNRTLHIGSHSFDGNQGIKPDISVRPHQEKHVDNKTTTCFAVDTTFQRALDILKGLRALNLGF